MKAEYVKCLFAVFLSSRLKSSPLQIEGQPGFRVPQLFLLFLTSSAEITLQLNVIHNNFNIVSVITNSHALNITVSKTFVNTPW